MEGRRYSKTDHRRALAELLDGRSDQSIEYKHANISAVLLDLGYPYVEGYKPRSNYQHLLYDAVAARLSLDYRLTRVVGAAVDAPAEPAEAVSVLDRQVAAPSPVNQGAGPHRAEPQAEPKARPAVDYLEREARNQSLGRRGEQFALAFEKARLRAAGHDRFAHQVEHVAETRGDGLGFDILSFESDGAERLIEVKTTAFGQETPFFVSGNELRVSRDRDAGYHVYRVFRYRVGPRLYILDGALDRVCSLSPVQYLARVG